MTKGAECPVDGGDLIYSYDETKGHLCFPIYWCPRCLCQYVQIGSRVSRLLLNGREEAEDIAYWQQIHEMMLERAA